MDITFGHKVGSELITAAFATMFGQKFASVFVALALMLFAFTTILGWSLYGSRCVQYLFGLKVSKAYQVLFIIVVVVGAVASLDVVWDIADTFNGLMAIPNFIALFALSGVVAKLTKEYFFDKDKLKNKTERPQAGQTGLRDMNAKGEKRYAAASDRTGLPPFQGRLLSCGGACQGF